MSELTKALIKLGSEKPELREHIRPILDRVSSSATEEMNASLEKEMRKEALRSSDTEYTRSETREGTLHELSSEMTGLRGARGFASLQITVKTSGSVTAYVTCSGSRPEAESFRGPGADRDALAWANRVHSKMLEKWAEKHVYPYMESGW